jgi:hypothetical protein
MLPAVTRTIIAATAALSLTAASVAPANAWGKNEQNFLKGVLATVAVGTIINQVQKQPRYVTRGPVYQQPVYAPPVRQPTYTPVYSAPRTPAAQAFADYSPGMRRAIQANLRAYGYYTGAIDGVWGPRTYNAVRLYAGDAGLANRLGTYGGAVAVLDGLAV